MSGIIPEFPKVLVEHLPHVLNRVVHIQLKPVSKNIEDYEVDFLSVGQPGLKTSTPSSDQGFGRKMGQTGLKTGQVGRWGTTDTLLHKTGQ